MYNIGITREHRTSIIFLIDQSGSMAGEILHMGRVISKAEVVAEVCNMALSELIERARRNGEVRNYYDIAILGYSGDGVSSLLTTSGNPLISIDELATRDYTPQTIHLKRNAMDGESCFFDEVIEQRIEAKASGATPMYEALDVAYELVKEWCSDPRNRESFPPMIYNISDGESSDCDYTDISDIAERIKGVGTNHGDVLLVNTHIASDAKNRSFIFPSQDEFHEQMSQCRSAMACFHAASDMPEILSQAANSLRSTSSDKPLKCMSFNCSITELVTILNIGSISVKRY